MQDIVDDISKNTGLDNNAHFNIHMRLGLGLQGAHSHVYTGLYFEKRGEGNGVDCVFKVLEPINAPLGEFSADAIGLKECSEENEILQILKKHRNEYDYGIYVANLLDSLLWIYQKSQVRYVQVCVFAFERADYNLAAYLNDMYETAHRFQASSKYPSFDRVKKEITIQLLKGIAYCHNVGIVHMDLKPANILVFSSSGTIQITDFGNSVKLESLEDGYNARVPNRNNGMYTTLWWRAPEMLYEQLEFTPAVDIWAIGCIFVTFVTNTQEGCYFLGQNENDMKLLISKLIGTPSDESWPNAAPNVKYEFNNAVVHRSSRVQYLADGKLSPDCINFIKRLLSYDHINRISALDALEHPFLLSDKDK